MNSNSFAERVIRFNAELNFSGVLPERTRVMNPFRESSCATPASEAFYRKFYNDRRRRGVILGINPGRFGAGLTGVPFTDPARLANPCGISAPGCPAAHEPSSVFVYEVIAAYGGVKKFYADWYINSVCPLGLVRTTENGREKNCNYYDSAALKKAMTPFILETLPKQLELGLATQSCVCLGIGKNTACLERLNAAHGYFERIIPLEHPRFIAQYRWHEREKYVTKYVETLRRLI